jgi:molybdopterin/thiamine biosynthesis adenylyltransferase
MSMYQRQETLGYNTNQNFIVIGAGGVGFHLVKMLAMAGVKKITVFDHDSLEEHNLNRLEYPFEAIGKNKAELLEEFVKNIRPECDITGLPFKFKPHLIQEADKYDWLVDCCDDFPSQRINAGIAKEKGWKYCKPGYNGESITLSNTIPTWFTTERSGYTITPSFVVPAVIVAGLTVAKVLKYYNNEFSTNLSNLYITG